VLGETISQSLGPMLNGQSLARQIELIVQAHGTLLSNSRETPAPVELAIAMSQAARPVQISPRRAPAPESGNGLQRCGAALLGLQKPR